MRLLARILGITLALVVALVLGAVFFLQDANRLKPEIETLIAENSDFVARIDGDIRWQLFPPLQLTINNVSLQSSGQQNKGQQIDVASLELKMDLSAMWEDLNKWQVSELQLLDTILTQDGAVTTLNRLNVKNFQPRQPADFSIDASHSAQSDEAPVTAIADGTLTYHPATDIKAERITLTNTHITTDTATGVCQADITQVLSPPAKLPEASDGDLLPMELLLTYNIGADCALSQLAMGTETFTNAQVEVTNIDGLLNVMVDVKDFLGGTLLADVDVDATQQPAQWTVTPEVANVDSQRLMDWTDQSMQWVAAIAFNSSIEMRGNSEAELANSVQAQSEFDGGQGQLNVAKIKRQLMQLALLSGQTDEVASWPDVWDYEHFDGRWNINGPVHALTFALDNMSVKADGDYDYAADTINMLAQVTMSEPLEGSPFKINKYLQGTPIPVRCKGPAADPKCSLEEGAAQNLIARALQSDGDSELRQKLDRKIEEEVPEEYRETARSILDILGRSLEKKD